MWLLFIPQDQDRNRKKGSDIEKIKKNISKITSDEVNVNIKEIRKPELDAFLVAEIYITTARKKGCI